MRRSTRSGSATRSRSSRAKTCWPSSPRTPARTRSTSSSSARSSTPPRSTRRPATSPPRLRITLTNDAPAEGLPDAIIGNNDQEFPFGTNRLRVHVYTPLALTAASLDDTEIELIAETELGWNRYRTTLLLGPGDSVVLTLDLAGRLDLSNGYVLDIEHQPMVNPDNIVLDLQRAPGHRVRLDRRGRRRRERYASCWTRIGSLA